MKLIDMPVLEAREAKWKIGREKYGPEFQGNPLEELHDELIDAMNYTDQAYLDSMMTPGEYCDLTLKLVDLYAITQNLYAKKSKG